MMVCVLESPAKAVPTIERWVECIRRTSHRGCVKTALKRICEELTRRFPADLYETDLTEGMLESLLPRKVREGCAVVVAFVEEQPVDESLCSWTVHFLEQAGVGAKIDSMVATVRGPRRATWKTRDELKEPLVVPPFGTAQHTWQFLWGPWQDSTVRLTYSGYSQGERGELLMVRCPEQYPG
jgi:hypothetical protein